MPRRILIQGAAGRDFHNFNTVFRGRRGQVVVAFTAAQIPDIDGRKYPALLAGKGYPRGIPIHDERDLEKLIVELAVDELEHRLDGEQPTDQRLRFSDAAARAQVYQRVEQEEEVDLR